MLLQILSPTQTLFDSEGVEKVMLPAKGGYLEILKGHAALITQLEKGSIAVTTASSPASQFSVERGGLAKVENDKIVILLES